MDVYQEAVDYLDFNQLPCEGKADGETECEDLEDDVFAMEMKGHLFSPLQTESPDLINIQAPCSPEDPLQRRLVVLERILQNEELYLCELETLLMPMKALQASAGTSQPVLSSQQVQTVFYQIPELRDMHRYFYTSLKVRLGPYRQPEIGPNTRTTLDPAQRPPIDANPDNMAYGSEMEIGNQGFNLTVADLFLKMMSELGVYGGFIDNYEKALEIVRKCMNSDARFRMLAQSMMCSNNSHTARIQYTFEALLYKPLDRITKTTLVLHELLNTTPEEHGDYSALQEALRLSRSFLSGVNESSRCKREVTLSHGMRRKLVRDRFVVDLSEGQRNLRHVFLYTDLLLCTKLKPWGRGKQPQYRFCWYMPLAGLRMHWRAVQERSPQTHSQIRSMRTKLYLLREQLRACTGKTKSLTTRQRKKLEQMELMLLTYSPIHRLELHNPSCKSHSLLLSSLYELEEWREAIHKLASNDVETVPPDLLTLTSASIKLRMTQQPPLQSRTTDTEEESLCGTLNVAIHSACGLHEPACVYVCVEVDGYDFYERQVQTHSSVHTINPHWDQELSFRVDGAQNLRVLCVGLAESTEDREDTILGKTQIKLDSVSVGKHWKRQILSLGQVEVTLSLKYRPHQLTLPSVALSLQQPVFCVPIEMVAQQEGVLIPHVVRRCVEEVERRGMEEVGIYRTSGVASDINSLKAAFNSDLREAVSRLRLAEVNVVSGLLKLYFRELPEPLVPAGLFQRLAQTLEIKDFDSKLASMLSLLQSCPDANRQTFLHLIHHLRRVSERQEVNKMSLKNLATIFGPSLFRPPVEYQCNSSPALAMSQEVMVQVHAALFYLQYDDLPYTQTSLPHDLDHRNETTHL